MPTEERSFARVAVPCTITLTVPVLNGSDLKDIKLATQEVLRTITDADDQIDLSRSQRVAEIGERLGAVTSIDYAAVLHFDTAEEQTLDLKTIFTGVKKVRVLDTFSTEVEIPAAPFAPVKYDSFNKE